jgi:hypothetical protein
VHLPAVLCTGADDETGERESEGATKGLGDLGTGRMRVEAQAKAKAKDEVEVEDEDEDKIGQRAVKISNTKNGTRRSGFRKSL